MKQSEQIAIEVWADWAGLDKPSLVGVLYAAPARGKEIFSFEYDADWLRSGQVKQLDPNLQLLSGPQYPSSGKENFGVFLDSAPDRWGRMLMDRRESIEARQEGRPRKTLRESDYLLGVFDGHRMGGLRYRLDPNGPFVDDNVDLASPPWASLRDLEYASLQVEQEDLRDTPEYAKWLRMLIAPGGSLGGARPKAGVRDERNGIWIAKFPSRNDEYDLGLWEHVVYELARQAGIECVESMARTFNTKQHTFLIKRFDRTPSGKRIHFASAMTLLGRSDGDDASSGASYLELVELILRQGAMPNDDLRELWKRIVFSICVSNTDDHLRNHGFLLQREGWKLSPAYDINPNPTGYGLKLNINEHENALDLELPLEVCQYFRIKKNDAKAIIGQITAVVRGWRSLASKLGISPTQQERMESAFRAADEA